MQSICLNLPIKTVSLLRRLYLGSITGELPGISSAVTRPSQTSPFPPWNFFKKTLIHVYWQVSIHILKSWNKKNCQTCSSQSWIFLKSCCFFVDDPECQYVQDSDNKFANDHRGQMMQFCGHDPICRKFNNAEALQKAKSNVEKHYAVVGTTENINMTLG